MSYWISLERDGAPCEVASHQEGGTYALGGSTEATINVTYNYSRHFRFDSLDGVRAEHTVGGMENAVRKLGTATSDDYWTPTEGNAGYAVSILLGWAKQHPDAIWRVN